MTLAMTLKAKQEKMPGAIAPGTPMSDVTKAGDTFPDQRDGRQHPGVGGRLL
jgi:hypothetical protein